MKKIITFVSACCMAILLVGKPAYAESVCYDSDFGWFSTLDSGFSWSVPQFDPTLGALSHVYLYIDALCSPVVRAEQTADYGVVGTVYPDWTAVLWTPIPMGRVPLFLEATPDETGITRSLNAFDGVLDYGGASGWSAELAGDEWEDFIYSYSDFLTNNEWDLERFVGNGTADFYIEWYTSCWADNSDISTEMQAEINPYVYVEYEYTPVPEPSGIWAMCMGVGGLIGRMRYRRRH